MQACGSSRTRRQTFFTCGEDSGDIKWPFRVGVVAVLGSKEERTLVQEYHTNRASLARTCKIYFAPVSLAERVLFVHLFPPVRCSQTFFVNQNHRKNSFAFSFWQLLNVELQVVCISSIGLAFCTIFISTLWSECTLMGRHKGSWWVWGNWDKTDGWTVY